MEFIGIRDTTIRASRIGLGTWAIGGWMWGGADDDAAVSTIHRALDSGITLIDTAPAYGQGHSEEVVGRALIGRRETAIVATKVGLEWGEHGDVHRNASPARVQKEIEDSLRRLRTEYIDIYQVHWPDPGTAMEGTATAMQALFDAGKIRAIGVSNFSPAQMDDFARSAKLRTAQPPYNLFERAADRDVLPYALSHGLTALTYGALCRGLLSGSMRADTQFKADDLRRTDPKFQQPRFGQYLRAVERLDTFARERYGKRVLHLALRWLLDRPGVGAALWGARQPEQLDPIAEIFDFKLDAEATAEIDRIVAEEVKDPVGPEFIAPPLVSRAAMMRVGVVGLGKMGGAIALNLLAHDYQVSVWNRSPQPIAALVEQGATRQDSLEALVEAVETVVVMLWGDDAAREVTLGRVIPTARSSQLVIEMSTLSPAMYETLESAALGRGMEFVAAPVLGSVSAAQQGSLTVLAGGSETAFERARPLLASIGATVTNTGSAKASGYLKLANNTVIGVVADTLAELLAMCQRAGVDRRLAIESISGAFGRVASSKIQQLLDRDSEPRFSLDALLKDLLLARKAAAAVQVPVPILDCVLPTIEDASNRGLGNRDYIAVALEST